MKIITFKLRLLLVVLFMPVILTASELTDRLSAIKSITSITSMTDSAGFKEKYQFMFSHPLDYKNPSAGNFDERIILCHVGFDRPTIVVTEGYWATYAENIKYREEISKLLNANIIVCEYRYFGKSMPNPCNWDYLTVENSLNDIHQVVTALKTIYHKKWLATGISKGGQTTMFYRAFFPNDVDVSVPYVAPLNKSVEDGRHEPFIEHTTGTASERQAVLDYQLKMCKRKSAILPYFEKLCAAKKYTFNVSVSDIYDYWILEYSFAFWQWGNHVSDIPSDTLSDRSMADFMMKFNDPSYFQSNSPFVSFNVQAARELGYYGYDTKPFGSYMKSLDTKDYLRRLMLPSGLQNIKFHDALYKKTVKFLKENDPKMIYIYGQYDPWSASGVCQWLDVSKKHNLKIFVQPAGSHRSRINNMPPIMKDKITTLLKTWME
jgi:hypothetical protein